jgi:hypothetical protein
MRPGGTPGVSSVVAPTGAPTQSKQGAGPMSSCSGGSRRWSRLGGPARLVAGFGLAGIPSAAPADAITIAAAAVPATTVEILAQPNASDLAEVRPQLQRTDFSAALTAAELSRGERDLLMALFDDYRGTLLSLAAGLEAERIAAGRDRYDDAIAGRLRLSAEELADLRRRIAMADLGIWAPASAALEDLLEICGLSLGDASAARFAARTDTIRRAAYLAGLAGGDADRTEAGESVDLERLVLQAADAELAGIPAAPIEAALGDWVAAIDPILGDVAGTIREARVLRRIARTDRDPRAMAAADDRLVAAWERLHTPLEAAAARVEQVARDGGGESAATAWRERVRRAMFPWLAGGPHRAELSVEWIERNIGDPAMVAAARGVLAEWRARRADCEERTVALVLEARRQMRRVVHPRVMLDLLEGGPAAEVFREMLRISGETELVDRDAEATIGADLSPEDRRRMQAAVRVLILRN